MKPGLKKHLPKVGDWFWFWNGETQNVPLNQSDLAFLLSLVRTSVPLYGPYLRTSVPPEWGRRLRLVADEGCSAELLTRIIARSCSVSCDSREAKTAVLCPPSPSSPPPPPSLSPTSKGVCGTGSARLVLLVLLHFRATSGLI